MNTTQTFKMSRLAQSLLLLLGLAGSAWAATPDAGSVLRDETRREQAPAPLLPPKAQAPTDEKRTTDLGPKTRFTGFRVVGLSSLLEAEAQRFLAPFAAEPLSMDGLHRVAEKFEQWLRAQGLFTARAYVPPQEIKAGVVEIRVIEGRLEGVDIKRAPGARISDDTLRAMVTGAQPTGTALEQQRLERGLLLLNDLPATSARAVLVPGQELGGSRVLIEAAQGPTLAGNVELDNTGNRYTGYWRLGATVLSNDPFGRGDQWSLRGATSEGTSFVRAGYTTPLGSNGLKAGLALVDSNYKLCCDLAVGTPESDGTATAVSGFVSYALVRTRQSNLNASLNWAERTFINRSLSITTSDKKSASLTLALSGDRSDLTGLTGQGGYSTYSLQWVNGQLDLDGWAADRAQDANSAQSHGGYDKLSVQGSHLLRLTKDTALYASLSGQLASKNLDSSEKFVLGGPQGVRAYGSGEASGDEGWLASVEWRREISPKWGFVAFADYGEVTLHKNTWANWNAANVGVPNSYSLSGAGVSAVWTPTAGSQITATMATRLADNPARDASGNDSDGLNTQVRFWVQGSLAF